MLSLGNQFESLKHELINFIFPNIEYTFLYTIEEGGGVDNGGQDFDNCMVGM